MREAASSAAERTRAAAYGVGFARAYAPSELDSILGAPVTGPRLIHAPVERAAHLYAQACNALCEAVF